MERNLTPLFCTECGRILGATYADVSKCDDTPWNCRFCLANIGEIADTIAVITEQDPGIYSVPSGLKNVLSAQAVFNLFNEHSISKQPGSSYNVSNWCYEQREKFTKKKTD